MFASTLRHSCPGWSVERAESLTGHGTPRAYKVYIHEKPEFIPDLRMTHAPYVILTAARNEAEYLRCTLDSVVGQTMPPLRWVVVDDGSTDATGSILTQYTAAHPWITVIASANTEERNFGSKAAAINAAFDAVREVAFAYVAVLDADVTLEAGHFEFLLERMEENPLLGITGTAYTEPHYDSTRDRHADPRHVSGQCQCFRRACFEDIGGYTAIPVGGIDWEAVMRARMRGWETRSYSEKSFFHHRSMGTGKDSMLRARFNYGYRDYVFGSHPLWQVLRIGFQMTRTPLLIGGLSLGAGYLWGCLSRPERPISAELMAYRRRDQMNKLRRLLGLNEKPAPPTSGPA